MNGKSNAGYRYNGIVFDHKKEVLTYATTSMNLENIALRKRPEQKATL